MAPRSSRIGKAWAPRKAAENFRCPRCGSAVRYCKIRGNLSPQLQCSDPKCPWILEDLIHESRVQVIQDKKPAEISSRQWYEASRVVG